MSTYLRRPATQNDRSNFRNSFFVAIGRSCSLSEIVTDSEDATGSSQTVDIL